MFGQRKIMNFLTRCSCMNHLSLLFSHDFTAPFLPFLSCLSDHAVYGLTVSLGCPETLPSSSSPPSLGVLMCQVLILPHRSFQVHAALPEECPTGTSNLPCLKPTHYLLPNPIQPENLQYFPPGLQKCPSGYFSLQSLSKPIYTLQCCHRTLIMVPPCPTIPMTSHCLQHKVQICEPHPT